VVETTYTKHDQPQFSPKSTYEWPTIWP
jgi:hypothetical protein